MRCALFRAPSRQRQRDGRSKLPAFVHSFEDSRQKTVKLRLRRSARGRICTEVDALWVDAVRNLGPETHRRRSVEAVIAVRINAHGEIRLRLLLSCPLGKFHAP